MSLFAQRFFFISRCTQTLVFLILAAYAWFFASSGIFADGTWVETITDCVGFAGIIAGAFLRIWALGYLGKWNGPRRLDVPTLVTRGPYAYVRHPLYVSSFIAGVGAISFLLAFALLPFFAAWAAWQHLVVVPAEERHLGERLGEGFDLYRYLVPKYIPKGLPNLWDFSFGTKIQLNKIGVVWALLISACLSEWLESPLHRSFILGLCHRLAPWISS